MSEETFEIEADSIGVARLIASARLSPGMFLHSEQILWDGSKTSVEAAAETVERALRKARNGMPSGAVSTGEEVTVEPFHKYVEVEAFDESSARAQARQHLARHGRIEKVVVKRAGRVGFMGIGRRPALYELELTQPAVVRINFKAKARLRVRVGPGKIPPTGFCQNCGREEAPFERSHDAGYFFCDEGCKQSYFKQKVATLMFDPKMLIINASGRDLSSTLAAGRRLAEQATAHCWYCSKAYPARDKQCAHCGQAQAN